MMKHIVKALMLVVITGTVAVAQNLTCSQTLRLARSTYEQGRLHELPDLVAGCLAGSGANTFTDAERSEAYKLLTLAYIYLEEPEKADETMLKLLQNDPEFKINTDIDPAEFVALYKTFRTEPIYRLGVKAGANASQPNVHMYSPLNEGSEKYAYGFGFQTGISGEIPLSILKSQFTLNPEAYFLVRSFNLDNSFYGDFQTTTGSVRMSGLNVPVLLQYQLVPDKTGLEKDPWTPYVAAGISMDLLFNVKTNLETKIPGQSSVVGAVSDKSQYKVFNLAPIIAAGVKHKVKKAELVAEVRFNWGASTIFKKDKLYDAQSAVFDNKFVHGPFSLNTLSVSVGYLLNKYSPKKKSVK